ncbi:MAG: deoxynucleoside kinase [Anaerolineae bacterium]
MPHPYIAIEGVIGVGKTTLARYLTDALPAELLLEVFEENPFLSDFYADRQRYAFQTQIFFLLSRYRQQHQVIPRVIAGGSLVSDYFFAKDRLFANLNLRNDELAVYESVYSALAERIPNPTLVVYLRAGVDTLMERIAVRDRPYERDMDRSYIADLHAAYDAFFESYTQAPHIAIETDSLNIVQDLQDRQAVIGQIKSALTTGASQPPLPHVIGASSSSLDAIFETGSPRRLPDFQQFHRALDRAKNFSTDLYLNCMLLTGELGELGAEIARVRRTERNIQAAAGHPRQALHRALTEHHPQLRQELADCMAYLIKLANYSGVDLEAAYLEKMNRNVERDWPHQTVGVEKT